jgi:Flp pilus assembly pilin Flp
MRKLLAKHWKDDGGALIATEYLFVATVLVIGTVVGLTAVRNAVNAELTELANAILALSQGYVISGQSGCGAATDGTSVTDLPGTEPCPVNTTPSVPVVLGCDTPCL